MLTIGRMAERYHMLPHEVAEHATTYDLMIMDVLATYDNIRQAEAEGKSTAEFYNTDTESLQEILEKVRD